MLGEMLTRATASTAETGVFSSPDCMRLAGGVTIGTPLRLDRAGRETTAVSVAPGASLRTEARKDLNVISFNSDISLFSE